MIREVFKKMGLTASPDNPPAPPQYPPDFDQDCISLIERVRPYTMTSNERIAALRDAVRHVLRYRIPGDFVECGVWRGGSAMAMALELQRAASAPRDLYLYDTYEGMPPPSEKDRSWDGQSAESQLQREQREKEDSVWCVAPMDGVRRNMDSTGYDPARVHLIRGRVEDTIPAQAPATIALLRLDTDWYESTRHELEHLMPRLSPGGILIIDDYGHWQGARRAVDEYLAKSERPIFLTRIDYTGRIAVMPA